MRIAVFSSKRYERAFFEKANAGLDSVGGKLGGHELTWLEPRLSAATAQLAAGFACVCCFVNDEASAAVLEILAGGGTKLLALRSAGFNNVDLVAAARLGIRVVRVPAYSPHAVAEHALALILTLNRKTHKAYNRVREGNFSLDGLLGFDLNGRTAGLIGMGRIGQIAARLLLGFGCRVLAFDPKPGPEALAMPVEFVDLNALLGESELISLHCPLMKSTHHIIDESSVARMKQGVMLINTSRGGLIDTRAVIAGLKSGRIGALGLDVYEEEESLFFEDLSGTVIQDDVFMRLLSFPNVLVTGHQGFFTAQALAAIAETTLGNVSEFEASGACTNEVRAV